MKRNPFMACVAMLGLVSANASAGLVLDQSQDLWSHARGIRTTEFLAQSFTQGVGLNHLTDISFYYYAWGSFPASATCQLRAGQVDNTNPLIDLPLLGTATPLTWLAEPGGWQTFSFATPIAVTPGNVYTFVLNGGPTYPSGYAVPTYKTGNPYAGGALTVSTDSGATWGTWADWDLTFRTYSAVPVPTTAGLLLVGGLLTCLRRRVSR